MGMINLSGFFSVPENELLEEGCLFTYYFNESEMTSEMSYNILCKFEKKGMKLYLTEKFELYEHVDDGKFRKWNAPQSSAKLSLVSNLEREIKPLPLSSNHFYSVEIRDIPGKGTVRLTVSNTLTIKEKFYCEEKKKSVHVYKSNFSERHGSFKIWRETKQLSVEGNYYNGKREGIVKFYPIDDVNGSYIVMNYKAGNIEDEIKTYEKDFLVKSFSPLTPILHPESKIYNERPTGMTRYYFKNGGIKHTGMLKNGKKTGLWFTYNNNKTLLCAYTYENGFMNGKYTTFYTSGHIETTGNMSNGIREGECKEYFEFDRIKSTVNYVKGVPDGIYNTWDTRRNTRTERKYVNGKLDTFVTEYYLLDNSAYSKVEGNLVNGLKHGLWKYWGRNKHIYEEVYANGIRENKRRRLT